jgi:hypothetical protein
MKTFNELEACLREFTAEQPAFKDSCAALMTFLRVAHGDAQGLKDYLPDAGEAYLADLGYNLHVELLKQLHVER